MLGVTLIQDNIVTRIKIQDALLKPDHGYTLKIEGEVYSELSWVDFMKTDSDDPARTLRVNGETVPGALMVALH